MKKNKLILTLLTCMLPLTGCFENGEGDIDINYDIDLNNKIELNVLMPYSGYTIQQVNSDYNATLIQQLTGYKVNYSQMPSTDASTTLNNELMDRKPYNAIKLTKDQFADLVKDDMLTDITDALEVFGKDLLKNISDESWDVVKYNGKIYGIPERASSDNIENPIIFNQDMLLANNLDIPTTLDEFENVLKVLTEKNNNYPALTFDKFTPLVYSISAAFGIYSDWQEYDVNGKKEILYYMNAPRYKDYIDYMHSLYNKGYIDQTVSVNTAADALNRFTNNNAACIACSIWSVPSIITSLQASGKISSVEANGTLDDYLGYLRALKEKDTDNEKVYRSSGYGYITAIPFYESSNAGYTLDWMNSKIKDDNFRSIVLGTEGVHYTYSSSEGYLPIKENFAQKDTASYYLTGSNENKYTEYWKARVRKQAELFRAWDTLMEYADEVGVYNIVDFTPPIEDYTTNRSKIEEYAQDQFYIMLKDGSSRFDEYINKLNNIQNCNKATEALNKWYYKK